MFNQINLKYDMIRINLFIIIIYMFNQINLKYDMYTNHSTIFSKFH